MTEASTYKAGVEAAAYNRALKDAVVAVLKDADERHYTGEGSYAVVESVNVIRSLALSVEDEGRPTKEEVARLVEKELRSLNIGCGDEVNLADALADYRQEDSLHNANDLIETVSHFIARAVLALFGSSASIQAGGSDAEGETTTVTAVGDVATGDQSAEFVAKYRKKPVVIHAIQWTGSNSSRVAAILPPDCRFTFSGIEICTLEGTMLASKGDWIIRGVKGEVYPCKPDIFLATYEAVGSPVGGQPSKQRPLSPSPISPPTSDAHGVESEAVKPISQAMQTLMKLYGVNSPKEVVERLIEYSKTIEALAPSHDAYHSGEK